MARFSKGRRLEDQGFLHLHVRHGVGDAADAEAGFAEAAEGHPIDSEGGVVVGDDGEGVEAAVGLEDGVHLLAEDGGLEGEGDVVGGLDGCFYRIAGVEADDGAEDFFLADSAVGGWVDEDGRFETGIGNAFPAGVEGGSSGNGFVDPFFDTIHFLGADEGADV